jgi:hypothetical protein
LLQKTIGISTPQPYLLNTGRRRSAGLGWFDHWLSTSPGTTRLPL